jgi:hypothetical protein
MKRLLLTLFLFLLPVRSEATTVERLSLDDLVTRAQKIVVGKVYGARTYWSGNVILTSYTIEVQETIKGQSTRNIEVTTIGGTVGEITLHVAGMPSFQAGEHAVVFLESTGPVSTVVGLNQGKFAVRNGEVFNSVAGLEFTRGRAGRPLRMPLESFKGQIRSRLRR